MDHLFLDIECCDGHHICSFGYVLTDERFNVLEKEDIVINPEMPFKLSGPYGRQRIKLAYTEQQFYAAPPFPAFYEKIRGLITAKDRLIGGHATENDANFLNIACERYGLPSIDFVFCDTQELYRRMKGEKSCQALESVAAELGIEVENLHRSDYDAELSMRIAAEMCRLNNTTFKQLAESDGSAQGYSLYGKAYGYRRLYKELMRCTVHAKSISCPAIDGRRVYFTKRVESEGIERAYTLVGETEKRGGVYVEHPDQADIIVRIKDEKVWLPKAEGRPRRRVRIIRLAEYLEMLGLSDEDIVPVQLCDIDLTVLKDNPLRHVKASPASATIGSMIVSAGAKGNNGK